MEPLVIPKQSVPSSGASIGRGRLAGEIPVQDWIIAGCLLALMLVLKALYLHSLPWHSDEPQHMHVVWSWATGRLPYRDVFDNHSPLFGFLFSPLFRWVGERDDIVDAMRWFMLPLFTLSLFCLYQMGRIAVSKRAGLWAAMIGGFFPPWFLKMGEFRTDVLWTTLWLVTLLLLVSGPLTVRRLFFAGLALGATFSVSMKTTLMLLTIGAAGGSVAALGLLFPAARFAGGSAAAWAARVGAALGGVLLIPAAFVSFFAAKGIFRQMYYCVIQHNLNGGHSAGRIYRHFLSPYSLLIPLALGLGWMILRSSRTESGRAMRAVFLLCVTALFCPILEGVWTSVTPQDYMPLWPLAGGLAAVALLTLCGKVPLVRETRRIVEGVLLLAILGGEAAYAIHSHAPLGPRNVYGVALIKEARALTEPNEYLMDPKGETVYRPRPYWYVLETLTRKRLYDGDLYDELPQTLIDTKTAVVLPSKRMMEGSLKFIDQNYVQIGMLHVLGKIVAPTEAGDYSFAITIPERYTLVTRQGDRASGDLDGSPFTEPRILTPGKHSFHTASAKGPLAVVWARATEKGFRPSFDRKENTDAGGQ